MKSSRGILLAASMTAVFVSAAPASAETIAEFYKAKNLVIMLGQPPGGSYDLYARLAAEHMRKHIPGNPTIIVQHKPGGGGVVATNFFYSNAPRDGSMIALFPETIAHTQLMDPKMGRWKTEEMPYIGSFAPVNAAFVVRAGAKAQTPEALKSAETVVGCTGKTSQSYQYPALMKAIGGMKLKLICGYKGSKAYVLAMERGEVDMVSSAWNSWRSSGKSLLDSGKMKVIMQAGLKRDKELPNIPLMQEVVTDANAKQIIEFVSSGSAIGRALIAPPQIPADKLKVLREAFEKTVKDKEFLDNAAKRAAVIDPSTGEEMNKVTAEILKTPKGVVEAAAKAMK
ncbi:MAG: Bug family tripartite tricarboxylate transporter substrate binding protein [Beijerinckiaceae bacterium]